MRWWLRLTRIPKDRQVPHIIVNGLLHEDLQKIACQVDVDVAETEEGVKILLQKLDKHFLLNTSVRKLELWKRFTGKRKTNDMTWDRYVQGIMKLRAEMLAHSEGTAHKQKIFKKSQLRVWKRPYF